MEYSWPVRYHSYQLEQHEHLSICKNVAGGLERLCEACNSSVLWPDKQLEGARSLSA